MAGRAPVPSGDPVHALVEEIAQLASADHWRFARFAHDAMGSAVLLPNGRRVGGDELAALRAEHAVHRNVVPRGPRIAAAAHLTDPYESGVTMLFADHRTEFGILSLLRTRERGAFGSAEMRVLTLALCSACERLAAVPAAEAGGDRSLMCVLEREKLSIVLDSGAECDGTFAPAPACEQRLPRVLESAVRELTASWTEDPATQRRGHALPLPFLRLRTQPLAGTGGPFIGVLIETVPHRNSLARAAARFEISPRESEVLALLLDGSSLAQIAATLHITSSTVQDHLKSLLYKTNAQNRSEMIAKVFGWRFAAAEW